MINITHNLRRKTLAFFDRLKISANVSYKMQMECSKGQRNFIFKEKILVREFVCIAGVYCRMISRRINIRLLVVPTTVESCFSVRCSKM